jgi:uncharacterized protein (DUF736 family)
MGYDNKNKGVLFKNKEKKSDNHPDLNGSIDIDGTVYWLSAWTNTDKNGNKYISLSRGDLKQPVGGQGERNDQPHEFGDRDVPF